MSVHAMNLAPSAGNTAQAVSAAVAAACPEAARIPAINVHAFCETPELSGEVERAFRDRRMARVTSELWPGDSGTAVRHYRENRSPHLILLETSATGDELFAALDALAECCEINTKLVLIGRQNDIQLYRALTRRGVSEYLCAPVDSTSIVAAIADVFKEPAATKVGRVYAFVGARGGAGSSTLAHNVAWTLGQLSGSSVILVDMDLAFGTAALDFDLRPEANIGEAMREPGRLDDQLLEKLLTRCGERFAVLSAPASLDVEDPGDAAAFESVLDVAQTSATHLVLDIPHLWSSWARRTLVAADEVVVTATPDLASLRNTNNLVEMLRHARPHDPDPRLILNQVGVPKRPEIKPAEFADVLKLPPLITLPFDPKTFGAAANTGRMLPNVAGGGRYGKALKKVCEALASHPLSEPRKSGGLRRFLGRSGR